MESGNTYWADRALLEWQVELGAFDAIQDTPIDRYALEAAKPKVAPAPKTAAAPAAPPEPVKVSGGDEAAKAAATAGDLTALQHVVETFAHCDLRKGARSCVFASGNPSSRVMLIAEAPNRAEDRAGVPFVGEEGQLLDKMLDAIGLARDGEDPAQTVYIAAPIPWRTPNDGPPAPADMACMRPFLERHIVLADPDVVLMMGATGLQMLTGQGGLTRRRGLWTQIAEKPALPMFHPAQLLKTPSAKREAWTDLLSLKSKLKDLT